MAEVHYAVGRTWLLLLQRADIPNLHLQSLLVHSALCSCTLFLEVFAADVIGGCLGWTVKVPVSLVAMLEGIYPSIHFLLQRHAKGITHSTLCPIFSLKTRKRSLHVHTSPTTTIFLISTVLRVEALPARQFLSTLIPSGRSAEWHTLIAKGRSCFL